MTSLPEGLVALTIQDGGIVVDPLTTSRSMHYEFELQSNTGTPLGQLSGVTGGSVEWNDTAQIKAGGKISLIDTNSGVDWMKVRVKPILVIEGHASWPLGVFIPSTPIERWGKDGRSWEIELLDRTSAVEQDKVEATYALAAGTVVTTAVKDLITSTGEPVGSITSTTDALANPMTWNPGTSKLTIVNDLLAAAGFAALWADGNGQFRVEKIVDPAARPVIYEMLDNENSVYLPDFQRDKDIYAIPNKVVAIAQGTGTTEGLVGVATNQDPNSPYSFQSRGRWITHTEEGVEATSQQVIDDFAKRSLAQRTATSSKLQVSHAPLPNWWIGSVVRFRSTAAKVDAKFFISTTSISFGSTELATTTMTEVVSL